MQRPTSAQKKSNPASFAMRSNSGGVGFGRRPFCARFGAGRPRGDDCIRGLAGANDLTFRVRHSSAMSSYGTKRICCPLIFMSAFRGKADMENEPGVKA